MQAERHENPRAAAAGSHDQRVMFWIAPSEKDTACTELEKRLWDTPDQFRANSGLKFQEYSAPVLDLLFLRFAEVLLLPQGELIYEV
jgi:hypothetical protein